MNKNSLGDVFGFVVVYIFLITFEEKKYKVFYYIERVAFHHKIFDLATFGLDLGIWTVNVTIYKYIYIYI